MHNDQTGSRWYGTVAVNIQQRARRRAVKGSQLLIKARRDGKTIYARGGCRPGPRRISRGGGKVGRRLSPGRGYRCAAPRWDQLAWTRPRRRWAAPRFEALARMCLQQRQLVQCLYKCVVRTCVVESQTDGSPGVVRASTLMETNPISIGRPKSSECAPTLEDPAHYRVADSVPGDTNRVRGIGDVRNAAPGPSFARVTSCTWGLTTARSTAAAAASGAAGSRTRSGRGDGNRLHPQKN